MTEEDKAATPTERVVLPGIRESKKWDAASTSLLEALEREEREAVTAYEAAKTRVQAARRAAAAVRRIQDIVTVDGVPPRQTKALPPPIAPVPSGTPVARWSRDHDACTECGRTEVRHAARGLCFTCYSKASKSLQGRPA